LGRPQDILKTPMPEPSNFKRFVEVGRVVLINSGPSAGKIAAIVEIIDHKRALIDGPSTGVPRQAFTYKHMTLLKYTLSGLPRAAGSTTVKKHFEKEGVTEKWESSAWAKRRAALAKRRTLNDFDRFSVMLAKKHRRDRVRRTLKKAAGKA